MRRPTIGAGARVALIAPGGPLKGEDDLQRAEGNARALGWEPRRGSHVLACDGYLAGNDGDRLADLNAALTDDDRVQHRVFESLRQLRDATARPDLPLKELSMGMSGDFRAAVAEGATMLRLGTILFGERAS